VLTRSLGLARPTRPTATGLAASAASLALATLLVWGLERLLGAPTVAVYLLAVVAVGMGYGSLLAVGTAIGSFLLYDFFFVPPYYTFVISAPDEWVDLVVFLVVAIAVGNLSALQLQRRREAELRSAEARAMFALSRDIATAATVLEAAPLLSERLAREAEMARVWIGIGGSLSEERVVADTQTGEPRPSAASRWTLQPGSADTHPGWVKVRETAIPGRGTFDGRDPRSRRGHDEEPATVLRVPIWAGGEAIGSVWGTRAHGAPFPGRSHSRLLAAAADQLGQSVLRDRLAAEATTLEITRQGDALKSALLDSVSHDLRTPLAAIRAAAGNLMDPAVAMAPDEVHAVAASIDAEAERLSRLVRNMLDLGRIEGGALRPSLELYDLADLVEPVVERIRPGLGAGRLEVVMPSDLPAVQVDAIFVDQIVTNLLENAAHYAPGKSIRVSARAVGGQVWLSVGDAGPGVPASALPHVFERFYRAPRGTGSHSEGGSGIGLAVVKGLAEAMGGSAEARPSPLGGLEVVVHLIAEGGPAEIAAGDTAAEGGLAETAAETPGETPGEPGTQAPAQAGEAARSR